MADQYVVKDSLGRGASGCAFLAERVCDGAHVVIKQVVLSTMTAEQKQKAVNEARVMTQMDHMNVIKYLDSYEQDDTLNIVLEYAPHGDLSNLIQERAAAQKPFTEDEIMFWGVQVTLALWHVHSRHILHRDLKSSNVFIGKGGIAKLGDFGIARALSSTQDVASTMVGTPFYLSPEICQDQPYDKKSDVWSLGVILYELCTLRRPFEAPSLPVLVMKILGGKYPPVPTRYSGPLRQLVDQCLQVEPRERLSSEQILQSDYVRYHLARYAQHVMRMTQSELSSAPLTLPGGKQPATQAKKPAQQGPMQKPPQEPAGSSSSSPASGTPTRPSDAAARSAAAEVPAYAAAGSSSVEAPGLVEERSDTDMAAAGGPGGGGAGRGRHQQLQDGWLEAQQAALEEMQAMLSALNGRGRASPVPGASPSPRTAAAAAAVATPSSPAPAAAAAAAAAPAASRVHLGELMQVAGAAPNTESPSAGPSGAAAVAPAGGAGPRRSVTPPKAPPAAAARAPTPPRQAGAGAAGAAPPAAAAAGGGGAAVRRSPAAGQGAVAVAAAGTPAKQRSQGALLPAVPKPPANALDLGLEELAAAGQLGMDNIQIPGMPAEASSSKQAKQLKGLAPKQVQVQRAIVAAKQHRHQEKQQYKQLQESLAREEEARRAARAAELEAAQQDRLEKQQKERQQAAEAAAAHKRAVKGAHARVDKSKLHKLGEQFLQQLQQHQQQAAAGNASGLVLHVALDGDDQQQQQQQPQQQQGSGSSSNTGSAEPGSRTSFHSRGSCSNSSSCQASQPASCTSSSPASRRVSASSAGPSGKHLATDGCGVARSAALEVQPHGAGAWTIAAGAPAAAAAAAAGGSAADEPRGPSEADTPCNPQMLHVLGQIHDVLAAGGVAFVVGSTTSAATRKGPGV